MSLSLATSQASGASGAGHHLERSVCVCALESESAHALRRAAGAGSRAAGAARSAEHTRFQKLRSRRQDRHDVRVQVTEMQSACGIMVQFQPTLECLYNALMSSSTLHYKGIA